MSEWDYRAEMCGASVAPLRFDETKCIRCLRCVEACQIDVIVPGEGDALPRALWPGECWYCGACVMECPVPGAVRLRHPLMNRADFVPRSSLGREENIEA